MHFKVAALLALVFLSRDCSVQAQGASSQSNSVQHFNRCYEIADVPFTHQSALNWSALYCQCFDKIKHCFDCDDYSNSVCPPSSQQRCVTKLWDYMHTRHDLRIYVDGYLFRKWQRWNNGVVSTHKYIMSTSEMHHCAMSGYTNYSVTIPLNVTFSFTIPIPAFKSSPVNLYTIQCVNELTFGEHGKFLVKEHDCEGYAYGMHNYTMHLGQTIGNAAVNVVANVMPVSVINAFFLDTKPGIIVFVGVVLLTMYVVLVYALLQFCSMCCNFITGGGSGEGKYGQSSGKNKYRVVDGFSTSTTMTEVDAEHRQNQVI